MRSAFGVWWNRLNGGFKGLALLTPDYPVL
jgi:hypothetical protein